MRIMRGVLAGIEGTFLRSVTDSKLVISIEMIQRSMAINIDGCDIEHISAWASIVRFPRANNSFHGRQTFINQVRSKP